MSVHPNGGMQIVTSLSTTHSDACLTRVGKRHKQQAKTPWQHRRVGGRTASGIRAHDPSCVRLYPLWQHIKDLIWTTLLIGTGVSAFTTGTCGSYLPSLCFRGSAQPPSAGYSSLS